MNVSCDARSSKFIQPRLADKDFDRSGTSDKFAHSYVGTPKKLQSGLSLLRETTEIDQWYTTCKMMDM